MEGVGCATPIVIIRRIQLISGLLAIGPEGFIPNHDTAAAAWSSATYLTYITRNSARCRTRLPVESESALRCDVAVSFRAGRVAPLLIYSSMQPSAQRTRKAPI